MSSDDKLPRWALNLRRERERRKWNKHEMARQLLRAAGTQWPSVKSMVRQITHWEQGKHFPRDWLNTYAGAYGMTLDQLFGHDNPLVARSSPDSARTVVEDGVRTEWDDDVERRALLQVLAMLTAQGALPVSALETVRAGLDNALGAADEYALEDWEQIAYEHACALLTITPPALIAALSIDIVDVRRALSHRPDLDRPGMQRVSAQLASLMALALTETGNLLEASRWWRTARTAADASGDLDLRVWVRGRHALVSQTIGRPGLATRIADRTIHLAAGRPLAGLAEAYATRAKVAAAGDGADGRRTLDELGDLFARLPAEVTDERVAIWGYPQERLVSARTGVMVHLGDDAVHDDLSRELSACTRDRQRARAELKMGWYLINVGEVDAGLERAAAVVSELPDKQRTTSVIRMAQRVSASLPDQETRALPAARELRALSAGPVT